jgi:hypothetical protein
MASYLPQRLIALVSFAFMLVMNVLADVIPLNGLRTNDISARYDTLFAPIGFTFAIWGVIYFLLSIYAVVQLVMDNSLIRTITPWFIASNVLNGFWIVAWHYEQLWFSAIIIALLLWSLIGINKHTTALRTSAGITLAIRIPFAVYFGWVTVATVANISALLVQLRMENGFGVSAETWTILILVVAVVIGSITALVNSSPAYAAVLVWAFWGILSRHLSAADWNQQYPNIIIAAQILLIVLVSITVGAFVRWIRQPRVNDIESQATPV